jgi:RluA family pseudouridine synthase
MEILEKNTDFIVVNKPAGILSQKDKSGDEDVAQLLKKQLEKSGSTIPFLHPVHRLDRNTSGILVLALNPNAAKSLSEGIQSDEWEKIYLAIVKGDPGEKGEFQQPLKKNEKLNKSFVSADGDSAHTEFQRIQKVGSMSLVKVKLHTGRSHQIRAHFAEAGHSLVGDRKYGKKPWSELFARPALHAHKLKFSFQEKIFSIECPLAKDMEDFLKKVNGNTK